MPRNFYVFVDSPESGESILAYLPDREAAIDRARDENARLGYGTFVMPEGCTARFEAVFPPRAAAA